MSKYIDLKEFRDVGYLQEVNRLFFHPLGLAMEMELQDDGSVIFIGFQDYRDAPEGLIFGEGVLDAGRARHITKLQEAKAASRSLSLGYIVQPCE